MKVWKCGLLCPSVAQKTWQCVLASDSSKVNHGFLNHKLSFAVVWRLRQVFSCLVIGVEITYSYIDFFRVIKIAKPAWKCNLYMSPTCPNLLCPHPLKFDLSKRNHVLCILVFQLPYVFYFLTTLVGIVFMF